MPGGSAFARVFDDGHSVAGRLLVLYAHPGGPGPARVGFAVGKRLGGAVVRNRVRRRMREAFRAIMGTVTGVDLVFVARGRALNASHRELLSEMRSLLVRISELLSESRDFDLMKVDIEGM